MFGEDFMSCFVPLCIFVSSHLCFMCLYMCLTYLNGLMYYMCTACMCMGLYMTRWNLLLFVRNSQWILMFISYKQWFHYSELWSERRNSVSFTKSKDAQPSFLVKLLVISGFKKRLMILKECFLQTWGRQVLIYLYEHLAFLIL